MSHSMHTLSWSVRFRPHHISNSFQSVQFKSIRNFLTLFLSIEVTKAMLKASTAQEHGDYVQYHFHQRKVNIFTDQLNESNPILTEISDAMTREGIARDKFELLMGVGKKEEAREWKIVMEQEGRAKAAANEKLMECNLKYQRIMKNLRLESSDNADLN